MQAEFIGCMGAGEGGGLPESSLEGKGSFISVVVRNRATCKTPQETGEDGSSCRPLPRSWLLWAPCLAQVSGWLAVSCPCEQRCWLKLAQQYLPPSPPPPDHDQDHGGKLWISIWVMSLCSRVGMGGWVGRRRDMHGEHPSQMEYRYNIFHTPGESVCIYSGGRGGRSMPGT